MKRAGLIAGIVIAALGAGVASADEAVKTAGWWIWEMRSSGAGFRSRYSFKLIQTAPSMTACVEDLRNQVIQHSESDNPVGPMVWNAAPRRVTDPEVYRACWPGEYNPATMTIWR
jgi:hypothetical protein